LSTLKELIQQLAHNGDEKYSIVGKVKSVDGLVCDVEPINGDADILDVRLVADETEKLFVLIPKVDSIVVVSFITKEVAFISMVSEVSEVKYKIGTSFYSVTSDGHLIQRGDDTLKQVIQLVIEAVQQIVVLQGNNPDQVKLTQALNKLNNLLR
jgi:hypothetical protein